MLFNFNIKNLFDSLLNALDPGIAKFNNFSGVGKYDMIVLAVKIRFFVLGLVLPELMLSHKPAFQ